MPKGDPYRPTPPFGYECVDCGNRISADHHPGTCAICRGEMVDVSVARE